MFDTARRGYREFEIMRTELARSEFRFTALRHGEIIADTDDFDTALVAFKNDSERHQVNLRII